MPEVQDHQVRLRIEVEKHSNGYIAALYGLHDPVVWDDYAGPKPTAYEAVTALADMFLKDVDVKKKLQDKVDRLEQGKFAG